jgi:alkylation response protein AidB-like acyl-CoA dehydrogenase
MDFDFGGKRKTFHEKIKGLFGTDPDAAGARLENEDIAVVREETLQWMKKLAQGGYLMPDLLGEKNSPERVAVQECLAGLSPSLFLAVEVSVRIFGRLVTTYGSAGQKREILPPLKKGEMIGTAALSEGGMSLENVPLNTTGVSNGPHFRISGSKSHVINAPIADWIAVAGTIQGGTAFFLVKKGTPGLIIGERLSTLGFNGTTISPVVLEDCRLAADQIIGPLEGEGPLKTVRTWEDQILTAAALGIMKRALDAAANHAKSHHSGGKPIIAYQEIGFKLAEMLTLFQTAQLLAYRAAWMAETGDRERALLIHCAKVFCSESAERLSSHALQILGGRGTIRGNPAEEGYRDAKYLQIGGTSTEISRMRIADDMLTGA